MNLIRRYRWPLIGFGAAVALVGFLLFRPDKLFVDDRVNESLADAFSATTEQTLTEPDSSIAEDVTTTTTTTTTAQNSTEPDSDVVADETTTTTEPPAGPVVFGTGSFYGIDHSAEGTATIYEQAGTHVLRFEDDTDIQNGPDLFVWVLAADDYQGGTPDGYIDLGKIKGNVGGQNYELPAEFDPDVHQFVLIWCKRFSVPFAAAPLA
jgi:hypothetical protein